jgi:hypothetical protein
VPSKCATRGSRLEFGVKGLKEFGVLGFRV